jgi:anti-sigma factor RsiW
MRRDHRFAQRRVSDYVDGDLSRRQRLRIARHVDECPECGPMVRGLLRIRLVLGALGRPGSKRTTVVPLVLERLRDDESSAGAAPTADSST